MAFRTRWPGLSARAWRRWRDLYRSIPSLETEGASVLDEFYWLDKDDPNSSLQRATVNRGEDAHTDGLHRAGDDAVRDRLLHAAPGG
ncbi:oleate hydratase [Polaromonas sp. DSR2-3-2]|uniref:oleate hydratase n=1 Tax=unclassified Polaromonas TaxID=2638319 RepID=UPI003CE8AAAE